MVYNNGLLLSVAFLVGLGVSGKEEGKKHGFGRSGGSFVGVGGQFVTATPLVGCEQGYVLAGDRCERLDYTPGNLECPKFSQLVGERCITRERVPAAMLCPPGTRSIGDRCETSEILVPLVECPKGWEMVENGKQCRKAGKGKGSLVCRDGWTLKGGMCRRSDIAPSRPSCPPGYLLQNSGKKHAECVMTEVAPPEVFCPKGWIAEGGACVHIKKKAKVMASCPPGFAPGHKGGCERQIAQDPIVTCPPGMMLGGEGKKGHGPLCVSLEHRPVIPSCKKGFEFMNNRCQKVHKGQPSVECPKGYELMPQGGCFAQKEAESRTECPPGSILRGKHCFVKEEHPIIMECPDSASLVGGKCVSHEIVSPRMICPDGFKKSKKNGGICEIEQVIVAEPNCPFEAHLSGKHCITRNAAPANPLCKKGDLTPEGCIERLKKEPKTTCPKGYKKHKGKCTREIELPAAFICPEGTILQEKNQCLATTFTPPRFSCPADFILDGNNNCLLDETVAPALACPVNTVLTNGQCYHAAFVGSEGKKKHKGGDI